MKKIKFQNSLVALVLSGEKTSTWRLFDEKNLSVGDTINLVEFGKSDVFAQAIITGVVQKKFKELTKTDKTGHETFFNDQEMYETYSRYYKTNVGPNTSLKIIWFELL